MPICASNVSMTYKKKKSRRTEALRNINLSAEAGSFTLITGRSGSGKTTLINILSGLLRPTGGSVSLSGTDIYSLDDKALSRFRNSHIGYIPQGQSALMGLTVIENVLLPAAVYGSDDKTQLAGELLERVGIAPLRDSLPEELSGGELRRLAIARALINKPEVIFADEPTNDLDDENAKCVLQLLRETADSGTAVITVSHEEEAKSYADSIFHLEKLGG